MRFDSLVHLARSIIAMSESERLVIFGSTGFLASFPELGSDGESPIQATLDADVIPFPFEEELGEMLHEAFGDGRKFHQRFGYHADIIRPAITSQFPEGWEERLVAVKGVEKVWCLDPYDIAAAKCRVGRSKDSRQLEWFVSKGILEVDQIRERLRMIPVDVAQLAHGHAILDLLEGRR